MAEERLQMKEFSAFTDQGSLDKSKRIKMTGGGGVQ